MGSLWQTISFTSVPKRVPAEPRKTKSYPTVANIKKSRFALHEMRACRGGWPGQLGSCTLFTLETMARILDVTIKDLFDEV